MKHYQFLLGLAALALAGCSSDDFLGGEEAVNGDMISFGAGSKNLTRGQSIGATAAEKLNNHFVVYGIKHLAEEDGTTANDALVYNMYNVEYAAGTAGTTSTNSANWEYVGKTAYSSEVTGDQSIKYWDYAASNGYTFYAFSSSDISYPAAATDLVSVEKIKEGDDVYKKGYTVTVKKGAELGDLYYSDRLPVAKSSYGNTVTFSFRNMTAKVRVGFYETIPGYSVKIDKFYFDNDATAAVTTYKAMDQTDATNFEAALQNVNTDAETNTFTVTYYDATNASVENRATVTNSTADYKYALKLGSGIQSAKSIGTASSSCTWDNEGNYTAVLPFEGNNNPMLIRCDYTLTSTDGSGETINVKNARVVVPAQYVQWKSNYAYTYLFKISDKTNGTTGVVPTDPDQPTDPDDPTKPQDPDDPTPVDPSDPDSPTYGDPEGLYPITFDAYVAATEDADATWEQETVTSVANNSVTTYQNGKVIAANDEYKAGDIYAVNSDTKNAHAVITPSAVAANVAALDAKSATIAKVTTTGDAISEATVLANLVGAQNGITYTDVTASLVSKVPAADGTNYTLDAVKFAAVAETTYAYIYCTTKYVAPTYAAAGDTFDATETYYFKSDKGVYSAASGLDTDNYASYKADLYTLTDKGTAGQYDVKIIKVAK